jgi:hypothetical protein
MNNKQLAEVIFTTMMEVPFIKLAINGKEKQFLDVMEDELKNVPPGDFYAGQEAGRVAMNHILLQMSLAEKMLLVEKMNKLPGFKELASLPAHMQDEIVRSILVPRVEARLKKLEAVE